jgi:hypothetical protein
MSITYTTQYLNYFDEVYKAESKTRLLETPQDALKFMDAHTVAVNKLTVSGNYTYSRTTGYAAGSADNAWSTYNLAMERGLGINYDALDVNEAKVTAQNILNNYLRTSYFPELDQYRFSRIYSVINGSSVAGTNIVEGTPTADTIFNDLDAGIELLDDAEVPRDNRILFISENSYRMMKNSGEIFKIKVVGQQSRILDRELESYDGHFIIRVPSSRFNTAFTFGEGSVTSTGKAINFMLVHAPAIMAVIKRSVMRIWTPEENLDADAYRVAARTTHGADVYDNKVSGVYIHKRA